jgi:23S rRNA pseudouridine2605 synthase
MKQEPEKTPKPERLQKILAAAGLTSRRKAEELILEGRVQVNGQVVTELGTKASLATDHIRVDGKLLQGAEKLRYFLLNKPKGFVTTVKDPEGRPTVMKFFEKVNVRLYPVGRLDYLSEGLLIVTNDGELANKLTRASAGVKKTYLVKISGAPSAAHLEQLRSGIMIEKGRFGRREGRVLTQPAEIKLYRGGENPWYEVTLTEGRNREIRKMFEEIGHHVEKIKRIAFGPLVLDVVTGEQRELTEMEVDLLRRAAAGRTAGRPSKLPPPAHLPLPVKHKYPPKNFALKKSYFKSLHTGTQPTVAAPKSAAPVAASGQDAPRPVRAERPSKPFPKPFQPRGASAASNQGKERVAGSGRPSGKGRPSGSRGASRPRRESGSRPFSKSGATKGGKHPGSR